MEASSSGRDAGGTASTPATSTPDAGDGVGGGLGGGGAFAARRRNRGNIRRRNGPETTEKSTKEESTEQGQEEEQDAPLFKKARVREHRLPDPLSFRTGGKADEQDDALLSHAANRGMQERRDTATRTLESETAYDRDARALREKVLHGAPGDVDDKKYRGMNSYIDHRRGFRRENTISGEKSAGAHGPLRGNIHVRAISRFDYQPDICKDYKETGFCSYGDACKFLHDRGDYKSGWELEREWEEQQKRKQEAAMKGWDREGSEEGDSGGEDGADDGLPFACFSCREPWEQVRGEPVVTRCRHYFCEPCALRRNAQDGRCGVCEQPTGGIFNVAQDILKKMQREQGKAGAGA